LRPVLPVIKHHHEKCDGTGYPDGLAGEDIPLLARVLAIVDVYDALTSRRAYRDAMSHEEAMKILKEETGQGKFDPELAEEFEELIEQDQNVVKSPPLSLADGNGND
jgi:putative two-component system response regulator